MSSDHLIQLNSKWGSWPLHKGTLLKLAEIDVDREKTVGKHISEIKERQLCSRKRSNLLDYGIKNDVLNANDIIEINYSDNTSTEEAILVSDSPMEVEEGPLDSSSLANELIACIENLSPAKESGNVLKVISLLSKIKAEVLSETILEAWNNLPKDDRQDKKRRFIIAMSSTRESRRSVCKDIILPWVQILDTFYKTLEIIEPVIHWLDTDISDTLVLPLLHKEDSVFIKDDLAFRHLFVSLSKAQRHHTLSIYLSECGGSIKRWQFTLFWVMVENTQLDEKLMSIMVQVLSNILSENQNDRNIGKVILKLAEELTPKSSKQLIQGVSTLCDGFKGVLKFRMKKVMDNLKSR